MDGDHRVGHRRAGPGATDTMGKSSRRPPGCESGRGRTPACPRAGRGGAGRRSAAPGGRRRPGSPEGGDLHQAVAPLPVLGRQPDRRQAQRRRGTRRDARRKPVNAGGSGGGTTRTPFQVFRRRAARVPQAEDVDLVARRRGAPPRGAGARSSGNDAWADHRHPGRSSPLTSFHSSSFSAGVQVGQDEAPLPRSASTAA